MKLSVIVLQQWEQKKTNAGALLSDSDSLVLSYLTALEGLRGQKKGFSLRAKASRVTCSVAGTEPLQVPCWLPLGGPETVNVTGVLNSSTLSLSFVVSLCSETLITVFYSSGPYFINSQYPLLSSPMKQIWGSPCLCLLLYFCIICTSSPSGWRKRCHTLSFFQLICCLPSCFALYKSVSTSLEESVFFSEYLALCFFHQWQLSLCSAPLNFNDKQWPLHADTLFWKLFSSFSFEKTFGAFGSGVVTAKQGETVNCVAISKNSHLPVTPTGKNN